jgi:hypothetical protein
MAIKIRTAQTSGMRKNWPTHLKANFIVSVSLFGSAGMSIFLGLHSLAFAASFKVLKSHDVTAAAASFLADKLVSGDQVYSEELCSADGKCAPADKATLPDYAWRLLGFTGAYAATKDSHYLNLMRKTLAEMKSRTDEGIGEFHGIPTANSFADLFSLHQAYEAYRVSGDTSFLDYFLTGMKKQNIFFAHRPRAKDKISPMLRATLARQYALAAGMFDDKDATAYFKQHGFGGEDAPQQLKVEYVKRAAALIHEAEAALPDSQAEKGRFEDECFVVWGKEGISRVDPSQPFGKEVSDFFKKNRFEKRNEGINKFGSSQLVLPCLHALKELSETNGKVASQFANYSERFLLPQFDSPKFPLCGGSGGILALVSEEPGSEKDKKAPEQKCANNVISTGDSAWAAFIFSGKEREFKL